MKKLSRVLLILMALVTIFSAVAGAAAPYATYTYSSTGFVLNSPEAYVPDMVVDSSYIGLSTPFDDPRDLFVDPDMNVYLVDAKNNRIICMDRYLKLRFEIKSFVNSQGVPDSLADPSGVFVNDKYIYVCDSNNNRIVMFHRDGSYYKIVPQPVSDLFDEGAIYQPVAVAVVPDGQDQSLALPVAPGKGHDHPHARPDLSGQFRRHKIIVGPVCPVGGSRDRDPGYTLFRHPGPSRFVVLLRPAQRLMLSLPV